MLDSALKLTMALMLVAIVPVDGDTSAWAQWGLAGLVVGYTLWRDWRREQRMSESLERHYAWLRDELLVALNRNFQAIERMARLLERGKE